MFTIADATEVAIQAIARQIDDKPSNDLIRHAITSGL
jgi:hypothetical protein